MESLYNTRKQLASFGSNKGIFVEGIAVGVAALAIHFSNVSQFTKITALFVAHYAATMVFQEALQAKAQAALYDKAGSNKSH